MLEVQLAELDRDTKATVKGSPVWRAADDLLTSVPGVGDITARTLIADLPELGQLDRRRIAALVGVPQSFGTLGRCVADEPSRAAGPMSATSRLVRRIRQHWPNTRLTIRGDGHYGRPEVMAWCEASRVDYILGLPGNRVLDRLVEPDADDVRVRRAEAQAPVVRGYTEARYGAKTWRCERRVAARIEATTKGLDIRFIVTNITGGSAEWLYDTLYCARGQAENLIKLHKSQLASDRTSCRSPLANQVRLVLHTGAYWLMLGRRDTIPKPQPLARAEFTTLRMRLIKIGARIAETASRVRIAFAAAHPEAALFASLARGLQPAGP